MTVRDQLRWRLLLSDSGLLVLILLIAQNRVEVVPVSSSSSSSNGRWGLALIVIIECLSTDGTALAVRVRELGPEAISQVCGSPVAEV